jgi:hypothetical protein
MPKIIIISPLFFDVEADFLKGKYNHLGHFWQFQDFWGTIFSYD